MRHQSKNKVELLNTIEEGENECVDFKQEISNTNKIAKTMVSFANHKGGRLLVGVRDNKTIAGITSEDEIYMLDMAAGFFCKPEIELTIKEWQIGDKTILEVVVPEGTDKPYYAKDENDKWLVHIRVKDKSLTASKIVVDVLHRQKSKRGIFITYTSKEQALLDMLKEREKVTLKEYCHSINISKRRASKILVNLISAGVIRSHTTEKEEFYTLS